MRGVLSLISTIHTPNPRLLFVLVAVLVQVLRSLYSSLRRNQQRPRPSTCEKGTMVDPSTAHPHVLWFDQVDQHDANLVGGKGANLGAMTKAGFPVPGGFCVTSFAYNQQMKTVPSLPHDDTSTMHQIVMEHPVLHDIVDEISTAYERLSAGQPDGALVAVRSSATSEDSADASFAGQLETYLGVRGRDQVIRAVRECWASVHSARVSSYRKMAGVGEDAGDDLGGFACCVVVQEMLDADSAGVMFTANPMNNRRDETVITGNWGIGESVVADLATPDTWVVRSGEQGKMEIVHADIATKRKMVVLAKADQADRVQHVDDHGAPPSSGTSKCVDVPSARQTAPCLEDDTVRDVAELGAKVQSHYGSPQDIEWGTRDGKVYLLQARPITTLSDSVSGDVPPTVNEFDYTCRPGDWVTTCNAREMFPGAGTPLTISTFGVAANYAMQMLHVDIGVRDAVNLEEGLTEWHYGSLFLNMTNTLWPMCAGMIGSDMAKNNGEMSILGRLNEECSLDDIVSVVGGVRPIWKRALNGLWYVKTMVMAQQRIATMISRVDKVKLGLDIHQEGLDARTLWTRLDDLTPEYRNQWADGIVTSSTSAAFMLLLMKLLCASKEELWSTKAVGEVAIVLGNSVEGDGSNHQIAESADALAALEKLKDEMLKDGSASKAFVDKPPQLGLAWLKDEKASGEYGQRFKMVLLRHGHRCIKEAEMRTNEWAHDSLPLVKLLQSLVRASLVTPVQQGASGGGGGGDQRRRTAEDVIASKKHLNFATRRLLRLAIQWTKAGVHRREHGKSLQIKCHTEFKRGYRKLAELLVQDGVLPDADLVYFFTHEELGVICCASSQDAGDAKEIARLKLRAVQRRRLLPEQESYVFDDLHHGEPHPKKGAGEFSMDDVKGGKQMTGTPVSSGRVTGKARIVRSLDHADELQVGEILVCPSTDVGWTPYFSLAGGLVTEIGGMLSHGAVVAREYGLPCVVNFPGACSLIQTGDTVTLDGDNGVLFLHS